MITAERLCFVYKVMLSFLWAATLILHPAPTLTSLCGLLHCYCEARNKLEDQHLIFYLACSNLLDSLLSSTTSDQLTLGQFAFPLFFYLPGSGLVGIFSCILETSTFFYVPLSVFLVSLIDKITFFSAFPMVILVLAYRRIPHFGFKLFSLS